MSGIEILGIAASLIQIAELGCRLSVKLCVFSRKIKSADKTIDSISQEISATGAVLQQLGSELSKDENAELCSNEALATTRKLVDNCMSVFTELESSLDGCSPGSNSLVSAWKQRVKFPFLEAQIEVLRSNLERLKSSLLVMLTVLVFAALVRSHRGIEVLKDHRALVETLIEEKNASERRYQQAQKHIHSTSAPSSQEVTMAEAPMGRPGEGGSNEWQSASILTVNTIAIPNHEATMTTSQRKPPVSNTSSLPAGLKYRAEEIQHHGAAVQSLLAEVDAFNRQIGYDFRDKLQGGILGAHWEQWAPLRQLYGEQVLLDAISEYPEVVRYWLSRLERETANLGTDSHVIMPIEKIRNSARKPHQAYSLSSPSQHSYLGAGQSGNHALQDYQMQLRELEKQNKNGLMMARQEQDSASSIQIAAHDASVVQYTHSHSKTERRYFDSTLDIGGDFGLEPDEHQIAPIGSDESSCEERGWPLFIESGQSVKDQTRTVENKREAGEESVVMAINKQQEMSAAVCMQDDDDPWTSGRYLSQVDDVEHVDSYNMIGAEDMEDDSMYVETGGPSSSDLSMLSSHCGSSFLQTTNSVTASQFINGIGAAFANQFRPLTAPPADYPDTRTRQTCQPHLITPRIDAPEVLGYPSDFDDYIARWTRLSDFEYANTAT
ncbi:hypothetical protein LTR99_007824 [Exophiala xenobiotica]|uniref:Azaphilone pigments biosynthesis cluster protein L N-terminal domain-containing protein n=1 Tax=Vermiconidia calcicola TaxID=1690605 RepID=A0AAV9Q3R6_9PEZI|nr:hypothetical protein LTR92_003394 [Exophiala xenobiotica]KAK5534801.1 hypothetical protein LTR23_008732 [Chaetothyriales sp. CCFEE 6169]KAK5535206.1 hypothetical protein LTR25_006214 [Vermiconidia calcicola]KAK5209415.1 hypothetical protein LTR41_004951 [Exophiala xenobiotica]KAK5236492.1 hypothetical protein LTR47_002443 [Exophiala xenobiotica]